MVPPTRTNSASSAPFLEVVDARPDADAPAVHFDIAFDTAFRLAALPFRVTPERAWVEIDDRSLTARFGPWLVSTPLANVLSAEVTGPYSLPKVIGGPHLSFGDRGLTFAGNARQGVCIRFVRPVRGIDPFGRIAHPGLTVTVAEPAALAELLDVASKRHGSQAPDGPIPVVELVQAEADELTGLSATELRARARDLGLRGVGKLRKAELVELLRAPDRLTD